MPSERDKASGALAKQRNCFQFQIRTILMITVIIALALAWWMDHSKQRLEIHILQFELESQKLTK